MIGVIIFIVVALLLLLLLFLWAHRNVGEAPSRKEFSDLREALVAFHLELPPPALAGRIFSSEEWGFVSTQAPLPVRRMFLEERTRIARMWLHQTKKRVEGLMNFYRMAVRHSQALRPATEVKLAAQYASFLIVYLALSGLIWVRGPFVARRMVQYGRGLAEQLYSSAAQVLLELEPAAFAKITAEWKQS
ncbi:MAG: hypothetical protein ACE5JX_04855 [Acidobacteriota bacterium]